MIILEDGTTISFGIYYSPDEKEYLSSPNHEKSFIDEVVPSMAFRLSNHTYNKDLDFYYNSLQFSLEGIIMIMNNRKSTTDPTEILSYVPMNPTEEQLTSLEENEVLSKIEIQKVYEFASLDFDDYVVYDSLKHYVDTKKVEKSLA